MWRAIRNRATSFRALAGFENCVGAGIGKRGGARVIYYFYRSDCPLYLLLAYSKAQATDLTPDEKRVVSALAHRIREAADGIEGGSQ